MDLFLAFTEHIRAFTNNGDVRLALVISGRANSPRRASLCWAIDAAAWANWLAAPGGGRNRLAAVFCA
jgi:hypothetical protein